jgi:multiple sugar transport system substrate-binding protein
MKTKLLAFLVLGLLVAGFVYGGGGGQKAPQGGEGAGLSADQYKVTEPITINWWHAFETPYLPTVDSIVEGFNKSQNLVTVVHRRVGNYDAVNESLVAAHAANTGLPAVAVIGTAYIPAYGAGGLSEDLNPYAKATKYDLSDFGKGVLEAASYEGRLVTLPFLLSTNVIFYNKTLAKSMGVQVPTKWSEMDAFMRNASKRSGNTTQLYAFGMPGFDHRYFETFFTNNGVKIINPDGKTTDIDGSKCLDVTRKLKEWCDAGYMSWAPNSERMRQDFVDGKTFAVSHTSSVFNVYEETCKFEVGMAWLPGGDTRFGGVMGNVILIPAKASQKEKNAGWALLEYLTSKDINLTWTKLTGYMPTRKSIINTADGKQFLADKPEFKVLIDNMDLIIPRISHKAFDAVGRSWRSNLSEMINKNIDPAVQMKKAAQEINEILADS